MPTVHHMQSCETSPVTEIGMIIHTDTHITDGNNVVIAQPLKISLTMSVNHCLTSTDTGTAVHVKILHRMACVRCSRPIKKHCKAVEHISSLCLTPSLYTPKFRE